MTPEQRNASMEELDCINNCIAAAKQDKADAEEWLSDLMREREILLEKFPEIKYAKG